MEMLSFPTICIGALIAVRMLSATRCASAWLRMPHRRTPEFIAAQARAQSSVGRITRCRRLGEFLQHGVARGVSRY